MKTLTSIGAHVVADGIKKLRIRCVGYAESSEHYADAVVVSATSLVLSIDGSADTTFSGASGTLLFATYTNLGKLVDEINSSPNWEAEIVAGLRTDAINGSELLARSTSVFRMYEEIGLYGDTSDSGVYRIGYLLESNKPFETVHGLSSQKTFHQNRVGLQRIRALINTSDAGAWDLSVYEVGSDRAASLGTLYNATPADNTEKDTGQTDAPMFHSKYGNSLYIVASDAAWADSGAYLGVEGFREQQP